MTDESTGPRRPLGIAILAVLHVLGGIGVFAIQVFVEPRNVAEADRALREVGVTFSMAMAGFAFLAALGILSGLGFWLGKAWGWWLGAFNYVYRSFNSVSALVTLLTLSPGLAAESRSVSYHGTRFALRALVSVLILVYLYRRSVLSFFGLSELRRIRSILVLIGIYFVLAIILGIVGIILVGPEALLEE